MSFLIIDTLQAVGVAAATNVTVELTDGRGDPITGYVTDSAEVIVFATVVTTDENGHVDIPLVPTEEITPGGSYYTVRIAEKQFLIQKAAGNQTLLDAMVTEVLPLDPIETNDLLDHINDPFNAHGASAISVIPNADLLAVDVQEGLEELQAEILDHVEDTLAAHEASAIGITPVGDLGSDNVQDALEELQTDLDTNEAATVAAQAAADAAQITADGAQTAADAAQLAIDDHIAETTDAHAATAISVVPFGTISSTDVQSALEELFVEGGGGGSPASMASDVIFTPAGTVSSTNVQDAIEELDGDVQAVTSGLAAHLADTVDAHDAIAISFVPAGDIASDNVQMAIEEVAIDAAGYLAAHVNDTVDAHDASAVSFVPTGTIAATDAQGAIAEVATDAAAATATVASDLAAHLADAVDAHDASAVSFVPASGIAATDAQAAIVEAKTDAQTYSDTNLATHTSNPTGAHAATAISFAPTGDIAATTVQAAIVELNAETADLNDPRIVRSDAAFTDAGELIGFPDRTASTLTMVNAGATYTINLTPVSSSFTVWAGAQKYVKSSVESVSMPKTSGLRYVYYNSSGTLTQTTFKWNWNTDAPVGVYYYSVAAGAAFFIDERHGVNMDNDTQQWLSEVAGSRLVSGIEIGNYTLTPSSPVNADNTFSTTAGLIVDADIQYTIPAVAVGGGAGGYGIFSRSGTTEWTVAASSVPVLVGTNYPKWNQNVAGTWQLTEASNGDFMNMWLLAVPTPLNGLRSYVLVPGEAVYANLTAALSESETTSPLLASFPFREAISHYRITIQCGNSYGSTGKFRIRQVSLLAGRSITTVASTETTDHAILLNRTMSDQHPASAITFTPTGTIAATDTQTAVAEVATDAATALTGHTGLATGAHAGTAISNTPAGNVAATTVQAAINELDTEKAALTGAAFTGNISTTGTATATGLVQGASWRFGASGPTQSQGTGTPEGVVTAPVGSTFERTDGSAGTVFYVKESGAGNTGWVASGAPLATHIANGTGAHAGTAISNTPAGNIAATTVQAAVNELDTEKAALSGAAFTGNVSSTGTVSGTGIVSSGNIVQAALSTTAGGFRQGASGPLWIAGTGSPEGVVTAPVSSQFSRTDGGTSTSFYIKESGAGNTGWVASGSGGTPAASAVTFSPTGTIAATDVQSAIAEVANEYPSNGAWTTFTPAFTAGITALGNATHLCKYKLLGNKTVAVSIIFVAGTTTTTTGSDIIMTPPFGTPVTSAFFDMIGPGNSVTTAGNLMGFGYMNTSGTFQFARPTSTTVGTVVFVTGTNIGTTGSLNYDFTYEIS